MENQQSIAEDAFWGSATSAQPIDSNNNIQTNGIPEDEFWGSKAPSSAPEWQKNVDSKTVTVDKPYDVRDVLSSLPTQFAKGVLTLPGQIVDLGQAVKREFQDWNASDAFNEPGEEALRRGRLYAPAEQKTFQSDVEQQRKAQDAINMANERYIPGTTAFFDNAYEGITGRKPYEAQNGFERILQGAAGVAGPGALVKGAGALNGASKALNIAKAVGSEIVPSLAIAGTGEAAQQMGITSPLANLALGAAASMGANKLQSNIANGRPKIKDKVDIVPEKLQSELSTMKANDMAGLADADSLNIPRTENVKPDIATSANKIISDAERNAIAAKTAAADVLPKDTNAQFIGDDARKVLAAPQREARDAYVREYKKTDATNVSFDMDFMKSEARDMLNQYLEKNKGNPKYQDLNNLPTNDNNINFLKDVIALDDVVPLVELDNIKSRYKSARSGLDPIIDKRYSELRPIIADNLMAQAKRNEIGSTLDGVENVTRTDVDRSVNRGEASAVRTASSPEVFGERAQESNIGRGPSVDAGIQRVPETPTRDKVSELKGVDELNATPEIINTGDVAPEIVSKPKPTYERGVNIDDANAFKRAGDLFGKYKDVYDKGIVRDLLKRQEIDTSYDSIGNPLNKPYKESNAGPIIESFMRVGEKGAENAKQFLEAAGDTPSARKILYDIVEHNIEKKGFKTQADVDKFLIANKPFMQVLGNDVKFKLEDIKSKFSAAELADNAVKELNRSIVGRAANDFGTAKSIIPNDTGTQNSAAAVKDFFNRFGKDETTIRQAADLLTAKFGDTQVAQNISADPIKAARAFEQWKTQNKSAIELMPDNIKAEFSDLGAVLDRYAENHRVWNEAGLAKSFEGGNIADLPKRAADAILDGANKEKFNILWNKVKDNPEAVTGLKSAVARGMTEEITKNGVDRVKSALASQNNLSKIFTPSEINGINMALESVKNSRITKAAHAAIDNEVMKLVTPKTAAMTMGYGVMTGNVPLITGAGASLAGKGSLNIIDNFLQQKQISYLEQAIVNPEFSRALAKFEANKPAVQKNLERAYMASVLQSTLAAKNADDNKPYKDKYGITLTDKNGNIIKQKNYQPSGVIK